MRKQSMSKVKTSLKAVAFSWLLFACAHTEISNERKPNSIEESAQTHTNTLDKKLFSEKLKFQVCKNDSKNYLEEKILAMPPEYLKTETVNMPNKIPVQCIQTAQRLHGGTYAICNEEDARPKFSHIKPCMSEAYVSLVYNAYHDVMDCFGVDPRDMFYQIMVESGFHINAINSTGFDSGMAQFTENGIKRVGNMINYTQKILLENSRPSCERISSVIGHFESGSTKVKNRCVMIDPPKNPYRSMLFAYLHTQRDQISLDEILAEFPEISDAVSDKIKRQLRYFSFNRGMTGIKKLLRGYVESRKYFNQKITEQDLDLSQSMEDVKKKLKLDHRKRDKLKRSKVVNLSFAQYAVIQGYTYMSDMAGLRDYVEHHYGKSCGEF